MFLSVLHVSYLIPFTLRAMALFNATKKQYGLHTHLLTVSLSTPPTPIALPSLLPELPPTPMPDATFSQADTHEGAHHLNLTEQDVAQFARFVREFVTMSLVPWMERCVLDWNETVRLQITAFTRVLNRSQVFLHPATTFETVLVNTSPIWRCQ